MAEINETSWKLSAYLDGELGEAEAVKMARALRDDPALQRELASLEATRELLTQLPRHRGGKALTDRIVAAAEQMHARGPVAATASGRWLRRFAAAAVLMIAAAAGVIVTATWFGRDDQPTGTTVVRNDAPEGGGGMAGPRRPQPGKSDGRDHVAKTDDKTGGVGGVDGVGGEVIFTHDLDLARRDVERVLLTNGLTAESRDKSAKIGKDRMLRGGGSNFRYSRLSTVAVSYEVVGTAEQVVNLRAGLQRIRKSQFVDQAPLRVVNGPKAKPIAEVAKKAPAAPGARRAGKGGKGFVAGDMAKSVAVLSKDAAERGESKHVVSRISMAMVEDRAVKGLDRLLDMVWGGQAVQGPVLAAGRRAGPGGPAPSGGAAQQGQKHADGKEVLKIRKRQRALEHRQEKLAEEARGLVTGNVQRLVITLNKSPLTPDAEARRAAAMDSKAREAKARTAQE